MALKFIRAITDPNPAGEFFGDFRVFGGGKGGSKAPSATKQAAAQTETNKETAWYNAMLQNMNQITPYGNLIYTNNGNKANPRWTSTITLSPEQQKILDSQNKQNISLSQLGEQQIGRITDSVASPYSYSGIQNQLPTYGNIQDAQNAAQAALMSRINPQFAQQEEALRTRLINQGIGQGSQAYQREMDILNQARNDANQQAVLNSQAYGANEQNMAMQRRLQEISEYDAQRNAPLNEYIGMTSGTQIQNPQFSSGGNQGIQPFDISGAMRNQYSNQQAAANNQNAAMSSMFGLGGSAIGNAILPGIGGPVGGFLGSAVGSLFSDIRLKENVRHIGEENGFPIYEFNYDPEHPYVRHVNLPTDKKYIGVMAQDVQSIMPDAVHESEGFMKVNYDMIGVSMREVA